MSNMIENNDNKTTGKCRVNTSVSNTKRYGLPVGSKGVLGKDNTVIIKKPVKAEAKTKPVSKPEAVKVNREAVKVNKETVKINRENIISAKKNINKEDIKEDPKNENKAVTEKTEGGAIAERKPASNHIMGVFRTDEKKRTVSVAGDSDAKHKVPFFTLLTILLVCVLLMFIIIDYVQIFENQSLINSLKSEMENSKEEEKLLSTELEQKYDIVALGETASDRLGMVGSENQKTVYIDISEDETVNKYEPETKDYGAIATVMDALGDSARAWIDMLGE